jgi:hypothetical protein
VCGSDLHQRAVAYHQIIVAAERRIRHHRQIVLSAPWEKITLNGAVIETVRDLIGRAAITVWDTEESFHPASVEVGHAPSSNFLRRAQLFETRYNVEELGVGDWRVQQIQIEVVSAETAEASLASMRQAISRHFVGLHFGNQEYAVTLTGDYVAY